MKQEYKPTAQDQREWSRNYMYWEAPDGTVWAIWDDERRDPVCCLFRRRASDNNKNLWLN